MGKHELVYRKHYPISEFEDLEIDEQVLSEEAETEYCDFLNSTEKNIVFVFNEEKYKRKDIFLDSVKLFADTHKTDIEIYEKDWGYVANLSIGLLLGCELSKKALIKALIMADSFNFFRDEKKDGNEDFDMLLSLDYFTHDIRFEATEK